MPGCQMQLARFYKSQHHKRALTMKLKRLRAVTILVALAGLVACQPTYSVGTADATNAQPTIILLTPSSTMTTVPVTPSIPLPSPTQSVTKTPFPPTPVSQGRPDISNSPVAQNLLFSGDEGCKLPCWYSLRIGESRVEQIQQAIIRAVGLTYGR